MSDLNDRSALFEKKVVDGNLEVDFLDNVDLSSLGDDVIRNFTVTQPYVGRIDLISYAAYNTTRLWWLIAEVNNIINPITEIVEDMVLIIPSLPAYYDIYNTNSTVSNIEGTFIPEVTER